LEYRKKKNFLKIFRVLNKKYGKENVIACSIHRDETTPHLIVYVVPIDEKGVECKKMARRKSKIKSNTDRFANEVKNLGLERGLENSKARHKTIKQFYAEIEKPTPKLKEKNMKFSRLTMTCSRKWGFFKRQIVLIRS
jgi:hypothetical protein